MLEKKKSYIVQILKREQLETSEIKHDHKPVNKIFMDSTSQYCEIISQRDVSKLSKAINYVLNSVPTS